MGSHTRFSLPRRVAAQTLPWPKGLRLVHRSSCGKGQRPSAVASAARDFLQATAGNQADFPPPAVTCS